MLTSPFTLVVIDPRIVTLRDPLRATFETALTLCRAAGGPVSLEALAAARRRAPATARQHLRTLAHLGWPLLRREGRAHWLVDATAWLAPAPRDETPPAAPVDVKDGVSAPDSDKIKIELEREKKAAASLYSPPISYSCAPAPAASRPANPDGVSPAAQRLIKLGVYTGLANELAALPWVTPPLLRRCVAALQQRRNVRNLPGLLVTILRNRDASLALARLARQRASAGSPSGPGPAPARPPAPEQVAARRRLDDWWGHALAELDADVDAQAMQLYLQPVRLLSLSEGVLVASAPSRWACNWLEGYPYRRVLAALAAAPGAPPLKKINFVVARQDERPA